MCLQAREDTFAGFLEDALRGGVEECDHTEQRDELIGTVIKRETMNSDRGRSNWYLP